MRIGDRLFATDASADTGFDHLALSNAGPDPDGFLDFFRTDLGPALRERSEWRP